MFYQELNTNNDLDPLHSLLATRHATVEKDLLECSHLAIGDHLQRYGISFEGRELPVSLVPTLIAHAELERVAAKAALIRAALQRILTCFLDEHRQGDFNGPIHMFFHPYTRWSELIASERRATEPIQLMRYDAIREDSGRWALIETNTCCPGGTIHCARIRDAWLVSPLGVEVSRMLRLTEFPIDRAESFIMHMVSVAREATGEEAPNLAICSYKGFYKNELASLSAQHCLLVEQGVLPGGELLLCDATEVECDGGRAFVRGKEIAVIYNKIDQLTIDPAAPELAGWVRAAMSKRVEFLNSLASMYLTEAKRSLAMLGDRDWQRALGFDAPTIAAIDDLIPPSYVLRPLGGLAGSGVANEQLLAALRDDYHRFVLKADMLTRGAGIYIGKRLSAIEWAHALTSSIAHHGIAQECVDTPRHAAIGSGQAEEFFGIDLFFFGGEFAGAVSRSHTDMVFNIGNGGREAPVLVAI